MSVRALARSALLVALGALLCAPCAARADDDPGPPRIAAPRATARARAAVKPDALPPGASAHLPAADGEQFVVTFAGRPQADVTAADVRKTLLAPILKAVGFTPGVAALSSPPAAGIRQPVADPVPLVAAEAEMIAKNQDLQRRWTADVVKGMVEPGTQIDSGAARAVEMSQGATLATLAADIAREEIIYPFQQLVDAVPVEHAGVIASRWRGQSIDVVHGSLLARYRVVNKHVLGALTAAAAAERALAAFPSLSQIEQRGDATVVLLYAGSDAAGVARLRYSYRVPLLARFRSARGPYTAWIDAETGRALRVQPLFNAAGAAIPAQGVMWDRDPGLGTKSVVTFDVNANAARHRLQLDGVSERVDYRGDNVFTPTSEVQSIIPNFNLPPFNDAAGSVCDHQQNILFQQVNLFASISRYRAVARARGIYEPFPDYRWAPSVEQNVPNSSAVPPPAECEAWSTMTFGACTGYYAAGCPAFSGGPTPQDNYMNHALDGTLIAHEVGHNVTTRLTESRPSDWCAASSCAMPIGWGSFHDLADFWAADFTGTNCVGGWLAQNVGGPGVSRDCLRHQENNLLPRLHRVTVPLDPTAVADHFPEKRLQATMCGDYCNGKVAAAALWEVRLDFVTGMPVLGAAAFGPRMHSALRNTGFFAAAPTAPFSDTDIYRGLYNLAMAMARVWATSTQPHATGNMLAGMARAGVFLVPHDCLRPALRPQRLSLPGCSATRRGADAVVAIDDDDRADDPRVRGVRLRESNYLQRGGNAPVFHVWTGPRYWLPSPDGAATVTNTPPCNTTYLVEVSNSAAFPAGATFQSGWKTLPPGPVCYATWRVPDAAWMTLQAGGPRVFYRATTRDDQNANQHRSTQPGNGLWTVPPQFAVITTDGRPEF